MSVDRHDCHEENGDDHSGHGSDDCSSPHAMTFHAGVCQEILFSSWMTHNALELFGACLAVFACSVLYEAFKYYRETLFSKGGALMPESQVDIAKNECSASGGCNKTVMVKQKMISLRHGLQTLLHIIQSTMSYLLMLIVMSFNVWICIAVVLGLGLGYFLFGWKKQTAVDVTEHCQ